MAIVTFTTVYLGLLAILAAVVHGQKTGWNYDGSDGLLDPNNWKTGYPTCALTSQSPINIISASASQTTAQLMFQGYNTASNQQFTLLNNGHAIQLKTNGKTIGLMSSRLNGTYVLEQLHFHWGASDNVGSEHSVDTKFQPLEIHFVHYNSAKYANVTDAASYNDSSALLVLGVFVSIAGPEATPSSALDSLISYFTSVKYLNNKIDVPSFPLEGLLPCRASKVYTYSGSLTTPGCAQVVNWNVLDQPIYVTSDQMKSFRTVYGDNSTVLNTFNYRPIQPLNNRTVNTFNVASPCTLNPQNPKTSTATMITTTTTTVKSQQNPSTSANVLSSTPRNGAQQQHKQCIWLWMQLFVAMAIFTRIDF